jgi:hypothetical protein
VGFSTGFSLRGEFWERDNQTGINDFKWIAKGAASLHQYEMDELRQTTSIIGVFSGVNQYLSVDNSITDLTGLGR